MWLHVVFMLNQNRLAITATPQKNICYLFKNSILEDISQTLLELKIAEDTLHSKDHGDF